MALSERNKRLLAHLGPGHAWHGWVYINEIDGLRLERQILNGAPTRSVRLVGPGGAVRKAPQAFHAFSSPEISATIAAWQELGPYRRRIIARMGFRGFFYFLNDESYQLLTSFHCSSRLVWNHFASHTSLRR